MVSSLCVYVCMYICMYACTYVSTVERRSVWVWVMEMDQDHVMECKVYVEAWLLPGALGWQQPNRLPLRYR